MGNEKANCFWEVEIPPNYHRVGIENFFRAKYDNKRRVPRDGNSKTPSGLREEKSPSHSQRPAPPRAPEQINQPSIEDPCKPLGGCIKVA
ncbi:hypothetical protein JHK85_000878 [Glycine max]|nr:hypothetical protein JHK85_000878 [Glycine max]